MNTVLGFVVASVIGIAATIYLSFRFRIQNSQEESERRPLQNRHCCLCLADFNQFPNKIMLQCSHQLHRECAEKLFLQEKIKYCPVCREEIMPSILK